MVLLKTRRVINDFLNQIGDENIIFLVQKDKDLVSLLKPDVLAAFKAKAAQNSWISKVVSREDVLAMIDERLKNMIYQEAYGGAWLSRQIDFLESLFGGV